MSSEKRAVNVLVPADLHEAVRRFAFDKRISIGEATRQALSNLVGWERSPHGKRGSSRRESPAKKR